jgi:hypothetical protein
MTLGWMLFWGFALLFLLIGILFARTFHQTGDSSIPVMQRNGIGSNQSRTGLAKGVRFIDVGNGAPIGRVPTVQVPRTGVPVASSVRQTEGEPDTAQVSKGVRRIRVNGRLVYDGAAASQVAIVISKGGQMREAQSVASSLIEPNVPSRGLIIRPEPLEKILSGGKTLELRKKTNKTRGSIALIQKGSRTILGVAEIGDCVGPMSYAEFSARAHEHGVEPARLRQVFDDGYIVGWKLSNVRRLRESVAYTHKPGAVTWVTLDESDRVALSDAMDLAR